MQIYNTLKYKVSKADNIRNLNLIIFRKFNKRKRACSAIIRKKRRILLDIPTKPSFDNFDDVLFFGVAERLSFRNVVPFFETAATTGRRRVLGDKNRMIAPGRLFSVVGWFGGRKPLFDKIGGVFENCFQTFPVEIFLLLPVKPDAAAKL